MFVIIQNNVELNESKIIDVEYSFQCALDVLNKYIQDNHDTEGGQIIYREKQNRFTCYNRGYIYGRTLLYVYEIIFHPFHDLEYDIHDNQYPPD
jgi:hypothetical protein